jgi:hypothetical protein
VGSSEEEGGEREAVERGRSEASGRARQAKEAAMEINICGKESRGGKRRRLDEERERVGEHGKHRSGGDREGDGGLGVEDAETARRRKMLMEEEEEEDEEDEDEEERDYTRDLKEAAGFARNRTPSPREGGQGESREGNEAEGERRHAKGKKDR